MPIRLDIETIEVHDFGPGFGKVLDELFLGIACCIELRDCAQFRVGAKYQVNRCGYPLDITGLAVATS